MVIFQLREVKVNPHDIYLKEFGKNLRRIRLERGLTMETLASDAEIENRQLGRIERGEINTSIISLLKIATVLKIEMPYLFEFDNKIKK